MIYTAAELENQCCTIEKLSFYVSTAKNYNYPVKIYMKLVEKTGFTSNTDFVAMDATNLVWEGTWNPNTTGWNDFVLSTPFEYDCNYELLIGVKWDGSYSSGAAFRQTSTTNYTTIYEYEDGNSADISGSTTLSYKYRQLWHPDIKVCMSCSSCPHLISNLPDWNAFCDCVNGGTDYAGETVTLAANVGGITQMAGTSSSTPFKGTFDGQGHTLTVAITNNNSQGQAPFQNIEGATIKDLVVTGWVTSSSSHAAGLVGFALSGTNTIQNCKISTNVNGGNSHIGGIVGHAKSAIIVMNGCLYDGQLSSSSNMGGLIGWGNGTNVNDGPTIKLKDCLFNGTVPNNSDNFHPIGCCNSAGCINTNSFVTNCYYYATTSVASQIPDIEPSTPFRCIVRITDGKGKRAYKVIGAGCVTVDMTPLTTYNVSGIVAYSPGIKYEGASGTIYGGEGDNMSLILGCINGGVESYSSDHGTLTGSETDGNNDPYTLTMEPYNTIISAVDRPCPIIEINTAADWNAFCNCVNIGSDYNGLTVNLRADISVTTMAGDLDHPFRGTFEGNEHSITVAYTANHLSEYDDFTAPFVCVDGVTIQNLRINGTINMGSYHYGAGMIGVAYGNNTITNCVSNVTISSSVEEDGTVGGFIVRNYGQYTTGSTEYTTTFNGCAFTGSLLGTSTDHCAGFVAWDESVHWALEDHYGKVVFNDCLFAPTSVTMGTTESATFSRYRDASKVTMNNSYYFQSFGTVQGKQAYSVTGIDDVTVNRDNATATYSVSGITAYSTGIKYNDVFYGGNEDVLALLLSHTGDFCGYAADHGTLSGSAITGSNDPYTLTMEAFNTQIGLAPCLTAPVCFYFNSDSYSTSPTDDSGLPLYWSRVYGGELAGGTPHIILHDAFDCGSNGIVMTAIGSPATSFGNTSIVILPSISGISVGTQITFKARFKDGIGRLRLGYMNGAAFTPLMTITDGSISCTDYSYTLTAAEAAEIENNDRHLAFEWFYNTNTTARHVFLDDICIEPSCDTTNVGDHSVTTTNQYLPSYNFYNYSLTQQIYKPCEIGKSGTLTSIAFYNGGSTKTRTYDIYLKTTSNNTFASATDWIPVTAADKVFSGSVTMTASAWTVIDFDVPFAYDGSSNLVVTIDDNTGSYSSSPHMTCRVYNADGNQAIRIYSDGTNYDPLNPGSPSGASLLTVKNQIKFNVCGPVDILPTYTVTVSANPAAGGTATLEYNGCDKYTVIATPNECYRFVNWTEGSTEVSTAATYSFTATSNRNLVANFEPRTVSISCGAENLIVGRTTTYSVSGDGLTDGQVTWSYSGTGSVTFSPNTGLTTTVTATGAGSGTITATISSCGGDVKTCTLSMVEVCDDPDTANVGDHSGTDTHANLPSQSYYNYSLTQQIYKPCEIGKTGSLTSIAFFNGGSTKTRKYDIYLNTTSNNTFASSTSWIPVTTADRVFSGSVTMTAGSWTVIDFDVPFVYDGSSNLVVTIDDNTISGSSGMACRVYNADGNQALYITNDGTNYNPLSDPITYSGTLTNKKNQIKFSVCDAVEIQPNYTVTVSANPTAGGTVTSEDKKCDKFTVTATQNDCYRFVNWTENGTEVSTDATYSFTSTSNRNLVANFEAYNVSITSDPDPLNCLVSGTEVTLTASTDIPMNFTLAEYTFTSGTDASRWYNVTNTTNIMDGSTSTGDYAFSTVKDIGFTFPFGGTNYTQFSVNSDGNLRLGPTVTGTYNYNSPFSSTNANNNNPKINGFGFDGYFDISSYGNYVHMQTFGTAPNRVLVVEFYESPYSTSSPNVRPYPWKWQVQLFENGTVQIVYASTAPASYGIANQIGLCVDASDGWTVSTTTHEATHFTSGTSTQNAAENSWPGVNRYYRFTPPCPYTWTYTGTEGTANCDTYTASPTQNSTYTVSVSGVGCTNKTASVDAMLKLEATFSVGPAD